MCSVCQSFLKSAKYEMLLSILTKFREDNDCIGVYGFAEVLEQLANGVYDDQPIQWNEFSK